MDQKTFHALYLQTPEGFKAELIGGIVYVASPVSLRHGDRTPGSSTGSAVTPTTRRVPDVRQHDERARRRTASRSPTPAC